MKKNFFGNVIIFVVAVFFFCGASHSLPLDLQLGVRPLSMGGAFVAVSDDSNASYWNPAGLTRISYPQISFMHSVYSQFSDLNLNFLGYSQKNVGFSWVSLGSSLKEGESGTTNQMEESQYIFAYGIEVNKKLSIGASLKRLVLDSEIGGGSGIGFDMGALYRKKNISFGIVLKNLATDVKNENVPSSLRFGTALDIKRVKLTVDIDSKKDIEGKEGASYRIHAGVEVKLFDSLFLRAGSDSGSLSFGFGFSARKFQIDFCQWSDDVFGSIYRFSLGYNFLPAGERVVKPKKPKHKVSSKARKNRRKQLQKEKLIKEGVRYFHRKKYRRAEKIFRKVLKLEPENDKSLEYLKKIYWHQAEVYYKKGKYKAAIGRYKEILKIDPEHQESKKRIEKCRLKLKKKAVKKRRK